MAEILLKTTGPIRIIDLYNSLKSRICSLDRFIDALDCLYILNKIEYIEEEIRNTYKADYFLKLIKSLCNPKPYYVEYKNHEIIVGDTKQKIKMTGFLYKQSPSFINFKNYFTSSANSIPEATSINVETLSVLDQI